MRGDIKKWTRGKGRKEGRKAGKRNFLDREDGRKMGESPRRVAAARAYVNRIKVGVENMLGPNTATPTTVRSTDRPGSDAGSLFHVFIVSLCPTLSFSFLPFLR